MGRPSKWQEVRVRAGLFTFAPGLSLFSGTQLPSFFSHWCFHLLFIAILCPLLFKENILNMHILGIPWWPSGIGAFSAEGPGSIPDWGTKIPQTTWTSNPLPQMHILSWSTASSLSCLSFVLGMVVTRVTTVSSFQGDAQPAPSLSTASHCYPK